MVGVMTHELPNVGSVIWVARPTYEKTPTLEEAEAISQWRWPTLFPLEAAVRKSGQAIAVYYDATQNDTRDLARSESELRCDEDPVLFRVPTPLASVVACRHGLWTPRSEQLIKIAATTPELAALQASKLFPHDIGALPCTIHAGGPYPGRKLPGLCGVTVKNAWSNATVSFTEDWSTSPGSTARHIWHVVIKGTQVIATSQSGDGPPQLWQ